MTDAEVTAVHEAAHLVHARMHGYLNPAAVVFTDGTEGRTRRGRRSFKRFGEDTAMMHAVRSLAGPAAQERCAGHREGCETDEERARWYVGPDRFEEARSAAAAFVDTYWPTIVREARHLTR